MRVWRRALCYGRDGCASVNVTEFLAELGQCYAVTGHEIFFCGWRFGVGDLDIDCLRESLTLCGG